MMFNDEILQPDLDERGGWSQHLTQRLRVLLHAKPLLWIAAYDSQRDSAVRHYDSLTLSIKLFDLLIESSGLDFGLDGHTVILMLAPLLTQMDTATGLTPDTERHTLVVERLLADLCNDDKGQKPFVLPYTSIEENNAVTRELQFWLMRWRFDHDGRIVLHLSNEAINLYLRSLALDIADAQTATEAVVQAQLESGRVAEAALSAREARLQSIRLTEAIERLIRETQRDLRRVHWTTSGPPLLDAALDHIKQRLAFEDTIVAAATEKLEHLQPGSNEALQVAEVQRLVSSCIQRHFALHQPLLRARTVFLDEQERQAFGEPADARQPDLGRDVLEPLLVAPRRQTEDLIEQIFSRLFAAQVPSVCSLADLITRQLQPRREQRPNTTLLPVRTLVEVESEPPRYPPEIYHRVETYLLHLERPTRLAELLMQAQRADEPPAVLELLALLALQWFAPDDQQTPPLRIERTTDPLHIAGLFGDDLLFLP
jgi:hypothetical protein